MLHSCNIYKGILQKVQQCCPVQVVYAEILQKMQQYYSLQATGERRHQIPSVAVRFYPLDGLSHRFTMRRKHLTTDDKNISTSVSTLMFYFICLDTTYRF